MSRLSSTLIVLLLMFLFYFGVGQPKVIRCIEAERQALLKIKQGFHNIKGGFLSSWGNEEEQRECCDWQGIKCANQTGHVVLLDLSPTDYAHLVLDFYETRVLRGNLSPLRGLSYLTHLDLSFINCEGNHILSFVSSLSKLRYLNLSFTFMSGDIPPQFANLSSLEVLGLSFTRLTIRSLESVSRLSSLRELDMSGTNLSRANDWFQVVSKLPCLSILRLAWCHLPNTIPSSLSLVNSSTSLSILDLSLNQLSAASIYKWIFTFSRSLVHLDLFYTMSSGYIPEALRNMSTLEYLDLGDNELKGVIPKALGSITYLSFLRLLSNKLEGPIPKDLGNLTSLTHLYLSYNNFEGEFPKFLWNLCLLRALYASGNKFNRVHLPEHTEFWSSCSHNSLQYLDLSHNQIQGSLPNLTVFPSLKYLSLRGNRFGGAIPKSIGQLMQLEFLELSDNPLEGLVTEAHFSKLSKLSELYLSYNSLIFNMSSNWVPPFQLSVISLGSCKLGPQFPKWLQTQRNYSELDISNSGISDTIPYWFWGVSTVFYWLDVSHNQLHGAIPNSLIGHLGDTIIDLSSNKLEGSIPHFLLKVGSLNLSTNRFSELNSICNVTGDPKLTFLDMSFNQLYGELPDCWWHFKSLKALDLSNNKLSGQIPFSIGSLTEIETLQLRHNSLTKELPSTMKSCTKLRVLDVGKNKLLGPIPTWIGEMLSKLTILSRRSNRFSQSIPLQLCHLSHLQLLDLSFNNISGSIPICLSNFTALKNSSASTDASISYSYEYSYSESYSIDAYYKNEVEMLWKGKVFEIANNLGLVKSIDLSRNKLMGEIPNEITELVRLIFLNLSRNSLSGKIPPEIGKLNLLDALDLSNNQLSGAIPSSLSKVDRLNTFDVSNNKLSGKIPTGTQLQSFEVSSYAENPELCGDPLPKRCPSDESSTPKSPTARNEESQDKFVTPGFYISIGVGFVVGFWGVCASLIFNKTTRYSCFNVFNGLEDWIYVQTGVYKAQILRMIRS